jgi:hypothetical protein
VGTVIEIDAPRREAKEPAITIRFRGEDYQLPSELPADALAPLLSKELDLVGVMRAILNARADGDSAGEEILQTLLARPNLPSGLIEAIRAGLQVLFTAVDPTPDKSQWRRFLEGRPSIPEYARLIAGIARAYGVSLGEAFRSLGLSQSAGATSKPISPASTTSTPAVSGATQPTPSS